jgi:hypothetical protein
MSSLIDLRGQRFGRLTVIKRAPLVGHGEHAKWICRCDCGTKRIVHSSRLLRGRPPTRSCGCLRKEANARRVLNLVGKRFGRLRVIEQVEGRDSHRRVQWLCACSCGNQTVLTRSQLRTGNTKSCGCLRQEFYARMRGAA